jgi:hypothetical protein
MKTLKEQEDFIRGQIIARKLKMNEDVSLDDACTVFWFEGSEKEIITEFWHELSPLRMTLQKYSKWKDMFVAWKINMSL